MIPVSPKIYHITHSDNLSSIIKDSCLYSDSHCIQIKNTHTNIGISGIKRRRLEEIEVKCNPGTKVGEYVPFYFCPRSIMLYLMYQGNHPDLKYRQGQTHIVHIQADMKNVIKWADTNNINWAFSDRNAGAFYTEFYNDLNNLDKINWDAVESIDFRDSLIKDGKQAEFLLYNSFPIDLIDEIGVISIPIKNKVEEIVKDTILENKISIKSDWYYL